MGPAAAERSLGDGGAAAARPEAPRAGKPGGPGTRRGPGTAGTPPRLPGELPLRTPPHGRPHSLPSQTFPVASRTTAGSSRRRPARPCAPARRPLHPPRSLWPRPLRVRRRLLPGAPRLARPRCTRPLPRLLTSVLSSTCDPPHSPHQQGPPSATRGLLPRRGPSRWPSARPDDPSVSPRTSRRCTHAAPPWPRAPPSAGRAPTPAAPPDPLPYMSPLLPGLKLKCSGYAHGPWSSTGLTATPGSPPTALCDAGQGTQPL